MDRLSANIWATQGAIVQFESRTDQHDRGGIQQVSSNLSDIEIKYWGSKNQLPLEREILVSDNNIIAPLIQTKRDITIGSEVQAFEDVYVDGAKTRKMIQMPSLISEWLEESNWDDYIMGACSDYMFHSNVFTEYVMAKGGHVHSIYNKKCRHVRAEKKRADGKIHNWYFSGNWSNRLRGKHKVAKIPAYKNGITSSKFILRTGDPLLSDDYYFSPSWWGGKEWIELANCIPQFHLANLKHSYNIRWHIQIPNDYFVKRSSHGQAPTQHDPKDAAAKETAARKAFLSKLNTFLAGTQNAGRAIYTTYEINRAVGKEFPGIKIEALKVDMQDKVLLDLFAKSNEANISSQGIHPTLANIQTQGKLSSGSEIRNAFLMYVAIKTPLPRRILLKPLNLVAKLNGWTKKYPNLKFAFKDIEITKLDEDKSGTKEILIDDGK